MAAHALAGTQAREVRRRTHPALQDEHAAIADLAHDLEMMMLVWMQAEEHKAAFPPQSVKEVQHEPDVAAPSIEPGSPNSCYHGIVGPGAPPEHEAGQSAREAALW